MCCLSAYTLGVYSLRQARYWKYGVFNEKGKRTVVLWFAHIQNLEDNAIDD